MMRICTIILLFISSNVYSATIQYTGIITEFSGSTSSSSLAEGVEIGDIVVGRFSYDSSNIADSNDWDAVGWYSFDDQNSDYSLSILDTSSENNLLHHVEGHLSYILIEDNWQYKPNPDRYPTIDAYTPVALLDNGSEVYFRLQNRDTDLDLITSDELPDYPMNFNNYNHVSGSITLYNSIGQIEFTPTSVTVVPILPAFALLLSSLTMLACFRRTKIKTGV